MDNLDETIINLRNEERRNENNIIDEGLYIGDTLYEFAPVEVVSKRFIIMLPTSFDDMSPRLAEAKYPSKQRPQCIKTNADTSVNMSISYHEFETSNEYIEKEAASMKAVLKKSNPAMEFYEEGVEELPDFRLAWFGFKSFGLDQEMFNIMFVAAPEGKMLHGVFNCLFSDYKSWEKVALQMIRSIRVNKN